jgi:pimeloyl-ACP methyl ester carboxylesterase
MESFRRQVPELERHYRVIRYARRFHPPSQTHSGSDRYTLARHSRDLLVLLDRLGCEAAHLVGSSYGGYVALGAALEQPDHVRSLVLGEPPILPFLRRSGEGRAALEEFERTALDPAREAFSRGDAPSAVASFIDGIRGKRGTFRALPAQSQEDLLAFAPELRAELTTDAAQFMPDIPCQALKDLKLPVLLVSGQKSVRLFGLITEELARCLTYARRMVIPGAGHAMHVMNPAFYTRELLRFLQQYA